MLTPHLDFKAAESAGVWQLKKHQIHALRQILPRRDLLLDPQICAEYGGDASPVKAVCPAAVALPQNTESISKIMAWAHHNRMPITVRGGGSGKVGGAIPIYGGLVLSTEKLQGILQVDGPSRQMVAQAGVLLKDIKAHARAQNLKYAPDPGSFEVASLGGTIATNAGGMTSMRYGVTGDHILALRVVLPTGEILDLGHRSPKGVVGYDLTRLMVGSEGTLGIITEARLALMPQERAHQTFFLAFEGVDSALRFLTGLSQGHLGAQSAEFLDERALLAFTDLCQERNITLPAGRAGFLVELEGRFETLSSQTDALEALCAKAGACGLFQAPDAAGRDALWAARRGLSRAVKRGFRHYISEDIGLPLPQIPPFMDYIRRQSVGDERVVLAYGHAGDGNLHVNILFQNAEDYPQIHRLLGDLFAQVVALGGTLSGEHGIGLTKRDFMHLEQKNPLLTLQKSIKRSFDPHGILNPGKIFPI